MAERYPQVRNAVAQVRMSGSSVVAFVYVQRHKTYTLDVAFRNGLRRFLTGFCVVGCEIEIRGPAYIGLDIAVHVYLQAYAAKSIVRDTLTTAFSNRVGGFFSPDNFTFGQSVYLSQVITRVMDVPGVAWAQVERFGRYDATTSGQAPSEYIALGSQEIARLDNDDSAPYNGTIFFDFEGGL
jgi:hypothetical protein